MLDVASGNPDKWTMFLFSQLLHHQAHNAVEMSPVLGGGGGRCFPDTIGMLVPQTKLALTLLCWVEGRSLKVVKGGFCDVCGMFVRTTLARVWDVWSHHADPCVGCLFAVLRFHKSVAFAAGGEIQPILERFEDKPHEAYVYIRAVKLWIRRWDGRPIVGGESRGGSNSHSGQRPKHVQITIECQVSCFQTWESGTAMVQSVCPLRSNTVTQERRLGVQHSDKYAAVRVSDSSPCLVYCLQGWRSGTVTGRCTSTARRTSMK